MSLRLTLKKLALSIPMGFTFTIVTFVVAIVFVCQVIFNIIRSACRKDE